MSVTLTTHIERPAVKRTPVVALTTTLMTAAVLALPALSATADDDAPAGGDVVSWGLSPAGVDAPDQRPYIAYEVAPGTVVYDHVAVLNIDDQPIDLALYSGDTLQGDDGGIGVRSQQEQNLDMGSWISFDEAGPVDVGPQVEGKGFGYTVVPFTVTVPPDAQPGDHMGAVVASMTTVGQGGEGSPELAFEQRVALRIYLRVAGDLAPGLVIDDLHATWQRQGWLGRGAITVTYTLHNTGNVLYGVEPSVRFAGPLGIGAHAVAGDKVADLLPGASVKQTVTYDGAWSLVRNTVTVEAKAVAPSAGAEPGIGTVRSSTALWLWPLLFLGLLLLLAGSTAFGVRRGVRRRQWQAYLKQAGGPPDGVDKAGHDERPDDPGEGGQGGDREPGPDDSPDRADTPPPRRMPTH